MSRRKRPQASAAQGGSPVQQPSALAPPLGGEFPDGPIGIARQPIGRKAPRAGMRKHKSPPKQRPQVGGGGGGA